MTIKKRNREPSASERVDEKRRKELAEFVTKTAAMKKDGTLRHGGIQKAYLEYMASSTPFPNYSLGKFFYAVSNFVAVPETINEEEDDEEEGGRRDGMEVGDATPLTFLLEEDTAGIPAAAVVYTEEELK